MKIYLSCSADGQDVLFALQQKLENAGHQLLSAISIDSGEDITDGVAALIAEADGFIFIIPTSWRQCNGLIWEFRKALERTWERPDLPLVGVVSADVEPPPFLQGRHFVRMTGGADLEAGVARVLELLNLPDGVPNGPGEELKVLVRERMGELSREIAKFHLTTEELEEQRRWVMGKIEGIARIKPDSVDVANLQIKLADILKALGNEVEVVPALEKGLEILERHERIPARNRAQVEAKLARALNNLGDHERALGHICSALAICGIQTDTKGVSDRLKQCETEVPGLVELLDESVGKVGQGAARQGRRLLDFLRRPDELPQEPIAGDDDGGESC